MTGVGHLNYLSGEYFYYELITDNIINRMYEN